jgi:hypothetical protein
MLFTVMITVLITSHSFMHDSFVSGDTDVITLCVYVASGADPLIKACGLPLLNAFTRAASVHSSRLLDCFMSFPFIKSSTIFKEFFRYCFSFYTFSKKCDFINCCSFNASHVSYQVAKKLQSVASSICVKNVCFSTSESAVPLNLLIPHISVIVRETVLFGSSIE